MACVTNKNSKRHRQMGLVEDEAPEPVVSEAELLIKELAQKQSLKKTSLAEQLSLTQNFVSSSPDILSVAKFSSGPRSFQKFSSESSHLELLDFLLSRGLDKDEIELLLDLKNGRNTLKEKYSKLEPSALDKRIELIYRKIKQSSKKFKRSDATVDSLRVELEEITEEHTEAIGRTTDNLDFYPPNHPINQLAEIERTLFSHLNETSIAEVATCSNPKKRKKKTDGEGPVSFLEEGVSQWDQKKCKKYKLCEKKVETVVKTCAPQTWYTIRDGKPVFLGSKEPTLPVPEKIETKEKLRPGAPFVAPKQTTLIPLDVVKAKSLTCDEIRKLPKFENYEEGSPTSILFLKNLAKSVVEEDLVQLFGNFEKTEGPAIVYRLMGGRMRGQAFLTFSDIPSAQLALSSSNGYELKGKPVIIQFGKQNPTTS